MTSRELLFDSASPHVIAAVGTVYTLLILSGLVVAVGLILKSMRVPIDWNTRTQWLRDRPWSWQDALSLTALVGLLIGLSAVIAGVLHPSREATLVMVNSLLLDGTGIAAIAGLARARGWSPADAFGLSGRPYAILKTGVLFYAALMPFMLFASLVFQGILYAKGYDSDLQDIALLIAGDHSLWVRAYMTGLAVIIAPLFEECLFRGILLPLLVRRTGMGCGIFITSLIFACIHFHLPSLVPLMVVASGFSLAYLYTGSLWVPIVMHSLFNGVNLALLLAMRP